MYLKNIDSITSEVLPLSEKEKKMRSFESQVIDGNVKQLTEIVEAQCRGEDIFLRSLRSRYAVQHVYSNKNTRCMLLFKELFT